MSNSGFCDRCGDYIVSGEEVVICGGGTVEIVCNRCYEVKSAAQEADTEAIKDGRVSQEGYF